MERAVEVSLRRHEIVEEAPQVCLQQVAGGEEPRLAAPPRHGVDHIWIQRLIGVEQDCGCFQFPRSCRVASNYSGAEIDDELLAVPVYGCDGCSRRRNQGWPTACVVKVADDRAEQLT